MFMYLRDHVCTCICVYVSMCLVYMFLFRDAFVVTRDGCMLHKNTFSCNHIIFNPSQNSVSEGLGIIWLHELMI